jgi:N-acetyl-D-muramate 6-phosphate phosphatase
VKKPIQAVLFDLDGTLLDTSIDLSTALNRVLKARNLPPLPHTATRPVVGKGCKGMLKMALNIEEHQPEYSGLCQELLDYYFEHVCDTTQFFPGVEEVLQHLEKNNIPWGIVTNKPKHLTAVLVEQMALYKRTQCIVSGDTLSKAKPHPEPLLHACEILGQTPASCLYVGDAEIDIIASKAAGIPVLAALYGFISPEENPQTWAADGYIKHPGEIINWL